MGDTRSTIESNSRDWVDDTDANRYAISSIRLHKIVNSEMQLLASRLDYGPAWDEDAVTYVSGTKDYVLTNTAGTIEYQRILIINRQSDGMSLYRVTQETMNDFYDNNTTTTGDPTHYVLWESPHVEVDGDGLGGNIVVNMRVYPTPGADESGGTQDHLLARIPEELAASTDALPFSVPILRAFEKNVASIMFRMMDQAERERRKIAPDIVGQWMQDYTEAIKTERIRINRQKRVGYMQLKVGT